MNCRGNETRKRIITEYIVEPKAHLKLLANQRKNSDAKKKLSSVEWELQEIS